jgi:serpin B
MCSLVISLTGCRGVFGRLDPRPSCLAPLDPQEVRLVAESSNALAFDLLGRLSGMSDLGGDGAGPDNVILAPISLSALLAMLLEGADGETAEAIAGVLHLGRPADGDQSSGASWDPAAPSAYGALLRHLAESATDVELSVANAIWPTTGYPLVERFVATMRADFGAEMEELDLGSQEAADVIDAWVAEKTRGRIKRMSDVLGLPDPGAVTVLMNAVYFKGSWTKSRTNASPWTSRSPNPGARDPTNSASSSRPSPPGSGRPPRPDWPNGPWSWSCRSSSSSKRSATGSTPC